MAVVSVWGEMDGEVFNRGPGARSELCCLIVVAEIDTSPDLNAIPEAARCVPSVIGTQPLCTNLTESTQACKTTTRFTRRRLHHVKRSPRLGEQQTSAGCAPEVF